MSRLSKLSVAEVHIRAYRAAQELRARSKDICRAHNDRIKQLEHLMRQISVSDAKGDDIPGVAGLSLSPEIEDIIQNPSAGL